MKKFKNHNNYVITEGLKTRGEVKTIQDQTLTIAQMLERLSNGIPLNNSNLYYPENEEDIQIRIKDLSELDTMKEQMIDLQERLSKPKNDTGQAEPKNEAGTGN